MAHFYKLFIILITLSIFITVHDNDDVKKVKTIQVYENGQTIDNNVNSGKYSYRLKQIDIDGAFEYSDVVEIDLGSPEEFSL